MHELVEALGELFDGILGSDDLFNKYQTNDDFREFVDTALKLYSQSREEVRISYGKGGVRKFNLFLSSRADSIRRSIDGAY